MLDPPLWYQLVLLYYPGKRWVVTPNKRVGADVHVTTAASFIFVPPVVQQKQCHTP